MADSPADAMEITKEEEDDEHMEQKIINEEYKIWKKNSVFLYDMIYSRALEWPTLSIQWFPDVKQVPDADLNQHRLLFGTHTSEQGQNYLQIATVEVPILKQPDPKDYDEQRGEIGGYGNSKRPFLFDVIQQINHPGEVNKARYMPQNPNLIASFTVGGEVLIFDRTKHPSKPKDNTVSPELTLEGHTQEGYGLSWSPHTQYHLATGSYDKTVKTWDVEAGYSSGQKKAQALHTYNHHSAGVNDVSHHPTHSFWIGTVSDDLTFQVIDTRTGRQKSVMNTKAHADAVNCLAWHDKPDFETLVATGSADKSIALWDLRNLKAKLHSLEAHRDSVVGLEWHPTLDNVLGSFSYDRRILFWDVTQIGEEQTPEESEDGPPELLFMHGGFTNRVSDFSFNKNDPWLICAAAEDNQMQIFRPSRPLVNTLPKQEEVQRQNVEE